jgi:hypothetical protein
MTIQLGKTRGIIFVEQGGRWESLRERMISPVGLAFPCREMIRPVLLVVAMAVIALLLQVVLQTCSIRKDCLRHHRFTVDSAEHNMQSESGFFIKIIRLSVKFLLQIFGVRFLAYPRKQA